MTQLELHKKIEEFFKARVESADVKFAKSLLINEDAKRFFFSLANGFWLDWLWQNGFLDEIKNKQKDSVKYVFLRSPEIEYLEKIAKVENFQVRLVDEIITSGELATKKEKFNPEVVYRFLWIINSLPAEQIKKLTKKIRDEKWVYLMRKFNKSGYEFTKIIEKLAEKKESESLLQFAEAILAIKDKTEVFKEGNSFSVDEPFCVNYLSASGIFEALANIEESYAKQALEITTGIMSEIVKLAELDSGKVFDYTDLFSLYDIDFFTLEIEKERGHSYREDVKNLAATIKKLIERTIGKKCNDVNEAKRLFSCIDKLPSCRSMWRLRLFALSQCTDVFKDELKTAFFKVFEAGERYFEIEGGAEYHQLLIRCFGVLGENTKREYIKKVFEYFGADLEDKDKEKWRKQDGLKIIRFIEEHLTPEEKNKAKEKFGHSLEGLNFTPEPSIGQVRSGSVNHKSPVDIASFSVEQIIANLKSEWTQEKLVEQFKNDDFLNPRDVEGLGDAMKEDVKKRTNEYLKNINYFFDRKNIHSHYIYSLLRGIEEMLRNKQSLSHEQISQLFGLFEIIREDGEKIPFKRKDDESWLVDWIETHKLITDILLYVLENKETREDVHKTHREKIKNLISYLFTIKDSPSKEQEKPEYGEPYHIAINSVRGRAYEAFVVFTENEGKVLTDYSKELYKEALADDSLAVRFVIGRYLASFYFRDKDFLTGLLPDIFPKNDSAKKDIYLATWEGYLSNTLYDKLFTELKDYYEYAIRLDPRDYTQRKYSKGLDESLAIHFALALTHLELGFEDKLFKLFWSTKNITRHHEFISFIGRSVFTRSQAGDDWLKENKVSKEKLVKFWDWILENKEITEPSVFSGFGFWINEQEEIIDDKIVIKNIARSLERSEGEIDWDYGLLGRLKIFAEKMPDKTIDIINRYLLGKDGNLNKHRQAPIFSVNNEIKDALKIIYDKEDADLNKKIVSLINTLIEKGSSIFWGLKDVIKND